MRIFHLCADVPDEVLCGVSAITAEYLFFNFLVAAQGSWSAVCDLGRITGRGGPHGSVFDLVGGW